MPYRIRSVHAHIWTLAALAVLGAPVGAAAAQEEERPVAGSPAAASPAAVPERVIVVWEEGVPRADRLDARADTDTSFVRTLGDPRFQLLRTDPGQSVAGAVAALRDNPAVRTAARDTLDVPHATTNDPFLSHLWGLRNLGFGIAGFHGAVAGADIDALAAWDRTRGIPSVVVADIDSGYRFEHPDLAAVAWTNPADLPDGIDNDGNRIVDDTHGADFVGDEADAPAIDGDPTDDNVIDGGHGVHTAGTMGAAGNDGVGISGVAQDVRIMPLRVCAFSSSEGETRCPSSSQIAAINYAGAHGARVANMSLGGPAFNSATRAALSASSEVLFAVSAGNGGDDGVGDNDDVTPQYPCAYTLANIVCVAATNQADQRASFSNFGAASVDLGAPGTETLSTYMWDFPYFEPFTVNDFAASWTATGADGGFGRTSEPPLTSFGMSDSPGVATPVANTERESTSAAFTLPPNDGCTLTQTRRVVLGLTGTYRYAVYLNGVERASVTPGSTSGGGLQQAVLDLPAVFDGGGSVQLEFRYTSGLSPSAGDGVWLDDLDVTCVADSYAFLDGTSMAAPHVTGAAGLLFSLKPSATVAEVKSALLGSVDPLPALSGRTVTGGRLNAAAALNLLVPIVAIPPVVTPPVTPSVVTPPVVRAAQVCRVPILKGLSLRGAKRALRASHCTLGRVTKPSARRGRRLPRLIVRSSRPRAGAVRAAGARVNLTLKPKPPRRARRR